MVGVDDCQSLPIHPTTLPYTPPPNQPAAINLSKGKKSAGLEVILWDSRLEVEGRVYDVGWRCSGEDNEYRSLSPLTHLLNHPTQSYAFLLSLFPLPTGI